MRSTLPIFYVLILGASPVAAAVPCDTSMLVSDIGDEQEISVENEAIDQKQIVNCCEPCGKERSSESTNPQENNQENNNNNEQPETATEFPNSPSAYVPLSEREKLNIFLKSTYAPYTFFS